MSKRIGLIMMFVGLLAMPACSSSPTRHPAGTESDVSKVDLHTLLQEELDRPNPQRIGALELALREYRVVFVNLEDFFFKPLNGFQDNLRTLENQIHVQGSTLAHTGFFRSYDENADLLRQSLIQLYNEGGKRPLILIGNPQTGPDCLYTAVKYPDLISSGLIGRIVMVQPAFGTPLLQYRKAFQAAAAVCAPGSVVCDMSLGILSTKLKKFDPSVAREAIQNKVRELSPPQKSKLENILYTVRAGAPTREEVPAPLLTFFSILSPEGWTDSISFVDQQIFKDDLSQVLGTDLTNDSPLSYSHWDLFASKGVNTSANVRESFTRALLEKLLLISLK